MIELLLEADRALANGALDHAERLYWQLIERDPKNAMAVAGLAEISLRRGDLKTSRLFTLKALAIDPDNRAATQMRAALEREGVSIRSDPVLPMQAVQQLEAIGRRRMAQDEEDEEEEAAVAAATPEGPEPGLEPVAAAEAALPSAEEQATSPAAPPVQPAPRPARVHDDFMSAQDFAAAEAEATLEAIDALDDSVDLEITKPKPAHRAPARPIRMPRLPSFDQLEAPAPQSPDSAGPQAQSQAQPPALDPWAEAERSSQELETGQLPAGDGGEPSEDEAEAEAFREAMALLRDRGTIPDSAAPDGREEPEAERPIEPIHAERIEPVVAEPIEAAAPAPRELNEFDAEDAALREAIALLEADEASGPREGIDEDEEGEALARLDWWRPAGERPAEPAEIDAPAELTAPADIAAPAEIAEPAEMAEPAEIAAPAQITEPAEIDGPAEITEPTDIAEPAEIAAPADIEPVEVAGSAEAAQAVEDAPEAKPEAAEFEASVPEEPRPAAAPVSPASKLSWETGVDPAEIRRAARPEMAERKPETRPEAKPAPRPSAKPAPNPEGKPGVLHRMLRRR